MNEKVKKFFDGYAAKFDALYADDVRTNLLNRFLRKSFYERLRLAASDVEKLGEGFTALDVGTGSGRCLSLLAPRAGRLVGVDMSEEMIARARARAEAEGYADKLELIAGDFLRLRFAESFDLVLALGYFDYVFEPAAHFRRMVELSRRLVLVSFPKRWHLLTPQRKIRYALGRCPVRFYSRRDVKGCLTARDETAAEVVDVGRDYYVRLRTGDL